MLIRREQATDVDAIDEIHRQAFAAQAAPGDDPVEVALVHALRADPAAWMPALSLVAELPSGRVVGHVVGTTGRIPGGRGVGIGPLGVLPAHHSTGVGSALMHAVLGACDAMGIGVVTLLGDPAYYCRFGFAPAASIGVEAPDPTWGEHFQARRLGAWTPAVHGQFSYADPFDRL